MLLYVVCLVVALSLAKLFSKAKEELALETAPPGSSLLHSCPGESEARDHVLYAKMHTSKAIFIRGFRSGLESVTVVTDDGKITSLLTQ